MPLYVGGAQKRRRVKLLTAGEDTYRLTNVTGGTVDIAAVVNDSANLRNVKIEWVQVSGEEVTLSSTDTLETSYIDSDSSDKSFEVYLDKGTNREQKKDVTFYKTPTSKLRSVGGVSSSMSFVPQTIPNLRFETGTQVPPITGELILSINVQSGFGISFDQTAVPALAGNAVNIKLFGALGVKSHVHPNLLADEQAVDGTIPTFFVVPEGSYHVEVEYWNGRSITFKSPTIFMESVDLSINAIGTDDLMKAVNAGVGAKPRNLQRYKFNKTSSESTIAASSTGVGKAASNLVRYVTIAINSSSAPTWTDDKVYTVSAGVGSKSYNLLRLDPSNIGSN